MPPEAETASPIEGLPVDDVYAAARTEPGGLTADEAHARAITYGPNLLSTTPQRPLLLRLSAHFTHLMALLLWAGSLLALAAGLPALCVAILLVNVVNGVFSFWQEFKADKATEALRRLLPVHARVMRDRTRGRGSRRGAGPGRRHPARGRRPHLGGCSGGGARRIPRRSVDPHGGADPGPQDQRFGDDRRRQPSQHLEPRVRGNQRGSGTRQGRSRSDRHAHRVRTHRRAHPGDGQ